MLLKEKARERKKTGLFVVEGQREIRLALKGGYQLKTLLYNPNIIAAQGIETISGNASIEVIETTPQVYEKIAHRGTTEGVLAIAQSKPHSLNTLNIKQENPLILVAEAPEKPGNIGALLRTADAAKLDAVLIANPKTDLYNPNIIRSSVGSLFTNQVGLGNTEEIIHYLKNKGIKIFCAALSASKNYVDCDFTKASALVMGAEATGLSASWLENSDQNIIIPMQGEIDSMNVSVSAAILIFEAKRQRGF
ncbi:RNA methyltransferase [Muricauda sp. JGD-17]|uniref:RNA methyltransferase n=1 Tax=Flagellimonas ochracea TaxID=2696472 RepID=A0A964T910_9FLAO|nr:RNA methyltransferase [Allomuricauda ochracea]NAY90470.1 RNA methyltransferase [Allomuricauda ochracea]